VAGNNFCVIATDTRMFGGGGYLLQSRNHLSLRMWSVDDSPLMEEIEESLTISNREIVQQKRTVRTAPIFIGSAGCSADCTALQRVIRADLRAAHYLGQTLVSKPKQVATLLSQILYMRRGFPYYSFCVLCGMERGNGQVFVYDAIGSYEQVAVASSGTGREALQPILDRLFSSSSSRLRVEGTADQAVATLYDAYRSVSEREIGVGDKLVLHVSECNDTDEIDCRVIVLPLKEH
jgi:20S proteasome subunit beta 6